MSLYEGERSKLHDMEVKVYSSDSEIQKLNKTIELCNKKVCTSQLLLQNLFYFVFYGR